MAAHPTTQELASFLGGLLAPEAHGAVTAHLDGCERCRGEVATLQALGLDHGDGALALADTHTPASRRSTGEAELPEGTTIGRYVVRRRLGQGAMGQVYEAHDPRLARRVAVKLLRHDVPAVESQPLRQRLEREAQALARLSHPNVVAVHDLGDHGDSLFIAMDYVEGETLSDWLRTTHAWREVQRVFLQAGAGLAAAHRAGLVHRDFKPDNVLVGADGVVRVSDFGVSRRVDLRESQSHEDTITGAGSLVGTPAYMSPEQFDGATADARSDQYAFCVTLFEALTGWRPYQALSLRELREAQQRGDARFPPDSRAPRWLQVLVLRGLSPRPAGRFPSMDELLVALRGPRRWSRSLLAAVGGLAGLTVVVGGLGARELERRRTEPCHLVEERLAAAWGPAQRERLRAGVARVDVPWATDSAAGLGALFDDFTGRWRADYHRACADVASAEGPARVPAAAQLACLDSRLDAFARYRAAFEEADARLLRDGPRAVALALGAHGCSQVEAPLDLPADPAQRAAFQALRARVLAIDTEARLGRATDLRRDLEVARAEADARGFKALGAALRYEQALELQRRTRLEEAAGIFEEAALRAEVARDDVLVFKARCELVKLLSEKLDAKRARSLLPAVRAAKERLGDDPLAEADLLHAEALVLDSEGRARDAIEKLQGSIELRDAMGPTAYPMLMTLGVLYSKVGEPERALEVVGRAKARAKVAVGVKHPAYGALLISEAGVLYRAERRDEAFSRTEEALAIFEKDPDTREHALATFNYGILLARAGRRDEGQRHQRAGIAAAEALGEKARLVTMYSGYAEELQETGRPEEALPVSEKALALGAEVAGPEAPSLARSLAVHGAILEALRRYPEAVTVLERSLGLQAGPSANPVLRDVTRYDLARVRWQVPATRRQAVDEVKAVRAAFVARGERFAEYVAECDEWLAKHPAR